MFVIGGSAGLGKEVSKVLAAQGVCDQKEIYIAYASLTEIKQALMSRSSPASKNHSMKPNKRF